MKKPLHVIIAQVWSLGLAQDIGKGVLEYARARGNWRFSRPDFSQALGGIGAWHPDGLIIASPVKNATECFKNMGCPVVMTHWTPDFPEIMQVDADPFATGKMAAEHLLVEGGYTNLAVCFYPGIKAYEGRRQGFTARVQQSGLVPAVFQTAPSVHARIPGLDFTGWLTSTPKPAAVFCCDDVIAQEAVRLTQKAGFTIPEEVAVLGCEDDELNCDSIHPALSSVHLPYRKIGYEAMRMLDCAIRGRPVKKKQLLLPPEGITTRLSTSVFATKDLQLRHAIEFIRRHAGEKITVHDVARHAGLSLRILQYRFKEEAGHSPVEEIQRARMAKVKELLRNTEMTLSEIAEVSGFQSGHYLSRHFKAVNRRSIRNYRNEFRRT